MGYLAIARKWRPHRFEDLVGQEHVVQTLKNAILLQRVSHAYLFSGARGVGKTSIARIFAKALRCPNAKDAIPCNECEECQLIADSRSVDVMEIDGASNNGVEAVRGIRENVAYGASTGHYKIYIIDEVHMLSLSAFNALLKTLEEPPGHVVFIFATTEVQKIPLTILSRCQRFEFRRHSNSQIVEQLRFILKEEKVTISEDGLRTIANHSDGSMRDSQSLLDQVLSFCSSQTTIENSQVVDALGVKDQGAVSAFLARIVEKDVKGIIDIIGETYHSGIDLKYFAGKCLEELRLLFLVTLAKESKASLTADELDVSVSHYDQLLSLGQKSSLLEIERMSQILGKTINQLDWSSLPRFVLEMAAVRMTKLDQLSKVEAALMSQEPLERAEPVAPVAEPIVVRSAVPRPAPPREFNEAAPPPPAPPAAVLIPPQNTSNDPASQWKSFVDAVMKKRPLLGALLCHANFKMDQSDKGKVVELAFGAGSFYERQALDSKNRTEIEEYLKAFFGKDTILNLSNAMGETTTSIEQMHQSERDSIRKTALSDPAMLKMKQILGADVVDVNIEN